MKRIATLFFVTLFIIACSKDNDDVVNVELEGQWELTDVTCFCFFGENPNFEAHKIRFEGSRLEVTNTGEYEFLTDAAGTYSVDGNLITFSNSAQYRYAINDNLLTLTFVDDPLISDDEIVLEYIRD